jgi:hypothetical protein
MLFVPCIIDFYFTTLNRQNTLTCSGSGTAVEIHWIVTLCKLPMYRGKPAVVVMIRNLTREVSGLNLARNIRYSN